VPALLPLAPLPLTHTAGGKILLGRAGAQLAVRANGETVIQDTPAGLAGEFVREALADTFASAGRREPKSFRYGVFTAVGDASQIPLWLTGEAKRDFALIAAYYGASDETFRTIRAHADVAVRTTGGKWQILKNLFLRQPGLFENFDFLLAADDDLIWPAASISRAFSLAQTFDLWVCQPAFDPAGRVSHGITQKFPGPQTLRYVNFVENTCPIFRADKLRAFMNIFDGSLAGYGVDFWYCAVLGGGLREIDKLRPLEARIEDWQIVSRNYNVRRVRPRILGAATLDSSVLAAAALEGE
jgi:hypothetical protein